MAGGPMKVARLTGGRVVSIKIDDAVGVLKTQMLRSAGQLELVAVALGGRGLIDLSDDIMLEARALREAAKN
jgi:hypothetical protein